MNYNGMVVAENNVAEIFAKFFDEKVSNIVSGSLLGNETGITGVIVPERDQILIHTKTESRNKASLGSAHNFSITCKSQGFM